MPACFAHPPGVACVTPSALAARLARFGPAGIGAGAVRAANAVAQACRGVDLWCDL